MQSAELACAQAEARLKTLQSMRMTLERSRGINKVLALECQSLMPEFLQKQGGVTRFSESVTQTNFRTSMEEISAAIIAAAAAAIAAVGFIIYKAYKWVKKKWFNGDADDDNSTGGDLSDDGLHASVKEEAKVSEEAKREGERVEVLLKEIDAPSGVETELFKWIKDNGKTNANMRFFFPEEGLYSELDEELLLGVTKTPVIATQIVANFKEYNKIADEAASLYTKVFTSKEDPRTALTSDLENRITQFKNGVETTKKEFDAKAAKSAKSLPTPASPAEYMKVYKIVYDNGSRARTSYSEALLSVGLEAGAAKINTISAMGSKTTLIADTLSAATDSTITVADYQKVAKVLKDFAQAWTMLNSMAGSLQQKAKSGSNSYLPKQFDHGSDTIKAAAKLLAGQTADAKSKGFFAALGKAIKGKK